MLDLALDYAFKAHRGMTRKGTNIPYITHPLEVMTILMVEGFSETLQIAGLLHDTIEDTSITDEQLTRLFGSEVAYLVDSVSEDKSLPWEERKAHTIESLRMLSYESKALLLADKLANLRSIHRDYHVIGDLVYSRFNRGKEQQLHYYQAIIDAMDDFIGLSMDFEYRRLLRELNAKPIEYYENDHVAEFNHLRESLPRLSSDRSVQVEHYLSMFEHDSESTLYLGLRYARGEGVLVDHRLAIQYLMKAMEQGSSDAPIYLSQYYVDGRFVNEDYQEALDLLMIGRRRGSKIGLLNESILQGALVRGEKVVLKTSHDSY